MGPTCRAGLTDSEEKPGQQRAHGPWMQSDTGVGVVPVALGLGDIYPAGLTDKDHSQEGVHLICWGNCHNSSSSEALMQCSNCNVNMTAARGAKSAIHWLEGNVNHYQFHMRHHSFLNDANRSTMTKLLFCQPPQKVCV